MQVEDFSDESDYSDDGHDDTDGEESALTGDIEQDIGNLTKRGSHVDQFMRRHLTEDDANQALATARETSRDTPRPERHRPRSRDTPRPE